VKRFTAIVAIGFSAVLAALGAATPAGAGGQAGLGCSPGFDVGAVTWEQYVNLRLAVLLRHRGRQRLGFERVARTRRGGNIQAARGSGKSREESSLQGVFDL